MATVNGYERRPVFSMKEVSTSGFLSTVAVWVITRSLGITDEVFVIKHTAPTALDAAHRISTAYPVAFNLKITERIHTYSPYRFFR